MMIEFIFRLIDKLFKIEKDDLIQIIRESFYILIAAILIGFIINIYHPKGYSLVSTSMFKNKQIVLINSAEAKIKKESGIAVFIDSRTRDEYADAHITGAINIPGVPASQSVKKIKKYYDRISQPKEIVLYCDGSSCGSSPILARRLIEMGYSKHLYIIELGIPEWREKGYPMETAKSEE